MDEIAHILSAVRPTQKRQELKNELGNDKLCRKCSRPIKWGMCYACDREMIDASDEIFTAK